MQTGCSPPHSKSDPGFRPGQGTGAASTVLIQSQTLNLRPKFLFFVFVCKILVRRVGGGDGMQRYVE